MSESSKFEGMPRVEISPEKRVQGIINEAFGLIQKRFVIPTDPEKKLDFDPDNELDFHGRAHTDGVIRRTEAILKAIQRVTVHVVSERDIALGKIAAAFHDVAQEWEPEQKGEAVMRKRDTGGNEKTSADEAIAFLDQEINTSEDRNFSKKDFETIKEAINGTVPGWDGKIVTQPNIKEGSSLIARALALADLGTAGMDGAEAFLQDGDALFREENLDIARAIRNQETLSLEVQEKYRQRMIKWAQDQPKFAEGRRNILDEELKGMPPLVTDAIKKLFSKFDESIKAATERAEERENRSFDELALDMGFLEKKPMNH